MRSNIKSIELQGRRADHPAPSTTIRLLSRSQGENTTVYRVVENETQVKFVTVDNNTASGMINPQFTLASIWRAGDWDSAVLTETSCWEEYALTHVSWTKPSVRAYDNGFLKRMIQFNDLSVVDSHGPDGQIVTCPQFAGQPLVFKHATSGQVNEPMANEAMAYGWLSQASDSLAEEMPIFLGHVCLDDTIVGFLTEHVSSRRIEFFSQKDHTACLQAVKDLHKHGVLHRDIGLETLQIRCDSEGKALKYGPNREHKAIFTSFSKASKAGLELDDDRREMNHVREFLSLGIHGNVLGKALEPVQQVKFIEYDWSSNLHVESANGWELGSEDAEETLVEDAGEDEPVIVDDDRSTYGW